MQILRFSALAAVLFLSAAHADEPKLDWLRERFLDKEKWECEQVGAHVIATDARKERDGVKDACVLTVVCTKKEDPAPKKRWPALLTVQALPKEKCPTLADWIRLRLTKDDVLKGAPMMSAHEFTAGVKKDDTFDLAAYGKTCKYEFAPPFVVWRKYLDPKKQPNEKTPYDRLCTNLVTCAETKKGKETPEPVLCAVADDGGCPAVDTCVEKALPTVNVPLEKK